MRTTIAEHDGHMIARADSSDRVFEVAFDTIDPTDVTLQFIRDGDRVGSIYNDDGTNRTVARLTTGRDGSDFIGVEVPKDFVAELLDAAFEADRITDETALEGYRLRVGSSPPGVALTHRAADCDWCDSRPIFNSRREQLLQTTVIEQTGSEPVLYFFDAAVLLF